MKNLIAATYAPMRQDGSLNLEAIHSYGELLKLNNVAGAFMNGSTGDFVSLSTKERKQITETWAKERTEDFLLVNHVGHTSLREAKELAAHSARRVQWGREKLYAAIRTRYGPEPISP